MPSVVVAKCSELRDNLRRQAVTAALKEQAHSHRKRFDEVHPNLVRKSRHRLTPSMDSSPKRIYLTTCLHCIGSAVMRSTRLGCSRMPS